MVYSCKNFAAAAIELFLTTNDSLDANNDKSVCLPVCLLFVCLWAMLPDLNKMKVGLFHKNVTWLREKK